MYYPMYYDPTYILIIIGVILSMLASSKVKSTYAKYNRVRNHAGVTGQMAAQQILYQAGIYDVQVQHVSGELTDHYDPKNKVLRLSDATYGSTSVAALGVAAHESQISWPLILIGLLFNGQMSSLLINAGIILFTFAVAFQIVTLPVEFNASSRALRILKSSGMLYEDEVAQARKVLSAAALTYVAGAAAAILQLLRLLILTRGRRDD